MSKVFNMLYRIRKFRHQSVQSDGGKAMSCIIFIMKESANQKKPNLEILWKIMIFETEKPPNYINENNGQLRFRSPPRVVHASRLDQFKTSVIHI